MLVCVECVVGGGVGVGVVQGRDGEIGNGGWPVILFFGYLGSY